ncbi:MAG: HAMP domain-containing histidine kinase [Spirochaetales bacterium]|nr:HAMP domain-containing histidine kinase [Spirochaetales bacterium]
MKPPSLRARFAFTVTLLLSLAFALLGTALYVSSALFLNQTARNSLRVASNQIQASLDIEAGTMKLPDNLSEGSTAEDHPEGFTERILSVQGAVLRSSGVLAHRLPSPLPYHGPRFNEAGGLLVYTDQIRDSGVLLGYLQVAQDLTPTQETLAHLLTVILLTLPFLLPLAAASGYFLAAQLLRPIDLVTRTAQRFSSQNLTARLGLQTSDDELGRLARTFDDMLERVEQAFRTQRQFTADASHELKTPLAILRTIHSVTCQRPRTAEEYRQALNDMTPVLDRLSSLITQLVTLARLDELTEQGPEVTVADLTAVCLTAAEATRPQAEAQKLDWEVFVEPGLSIRAEPSQLLTVVLNLLHNALKFTTAGRITLQAKRQSAPGNEKTVELSVSDTGCGIPYEDQPHVFERFFRSPSASGVEGSGLGLAIVQSLVKRWGGSVAVESREGEGSTFRLRFPLVTPEYRSDRLPSGSRHAKP